ncbi:MAG: hypothetical protein MUE85_06920 [Microscillaceae bacterium]|jgi:hypothetical protein|nr:hypothetical protein [Microscillaceae bacterium]
MNNEQKLILEVTLAETQAILEALSHLPFRQVSGSGSIQNLQTQATTQLQAKAQNSEAQNKNQELVK